MTWITFGKERYHQHEEMQSWCRQHFGPGKWIAEHEVKEWEGLPNWTIHSMFGNTTFNFKNPKDCTLFILRWGLEETF